MASYKTNNAKTKNGVNAKNNKQMDKARKSLLHLHALREVTADHRLIILERNMHHSNAIQGTLLVNNHTFETIELPWKNNIVNRSCIPTGTYTYQKITRSSNKEPAVWLRNVKDRSEILIHHGTKPQHSQGCILLPEYRKFHNIVNSKGLIVIL